MAVLLSSLFIEFDADILQGLFPIYQYALMYLWRRHGPNYELDKCRMLGNPIPVSYPERNIYALRPGPSDSIMNSALSLDVSKRGEISMIITVDKDQKDLVYTVCDFITGATCRTVFSCAV